MPSPGHATFFGKRNQVSLITDDEEDVQASNPPAADQYSSGEDSSGESYSAEGSPNKSGAEEGDREEADEEESEGGESSSSSTENSPPHASSAASQTNSLPKSSPASTLKKGKRLSKAIGPNLQSETPRRPRNFATYNLKTLSRQAIGYSDYSPKKRHPQILDAGSRRQSEPPTYNLKELVQRTRGQPKGTQRLINNVAKRPAKGNAGAAGQMSSLSRAWPVSNDSNDDDIPPKRQRFNPDTSIADSFASDAPDVTDSAIQQTNPASYSAIQKPWKIGPVPSKLQDSTALLQYITPWIEQGGGVLDSKAIADDERMANMLALPMQRTIEWNNASRNRWVVTTKIDIVALVMQLTGDDPPLPCNRCTSDPKYGQWVGCKVVSSEMVSDAWRLYGCANCVYHGKQTYCSLKSWSRNRTTGEAVSREFRKQESHDGDAKNDSSEDAHENESSAADITTTMDRDAHSYASGRSAKQNGNGAAMRVKPTQYQGASLVSVGRDVDTPLIMEPWEKAPGRIRSRKTEKAESKFSQFAISGYTWLRGFRS